MNSKRSSPDSHNADRQRGASRSLDRLDQTLGELEQRARRAAGMQRRETGNDSLGDIAARIQRLSQQAGGGARERPYGETGASRGDEGLESAARIAAELRGMREELREQMTTSLQREFAKFKLDIERAYAAGSSDAAAELGTEFERLSDAIHSLAGRGDDKNVNMLRLELEQVKGVLNSLAREETVRSVDRRWDAFDRKWDALEDRLADQTPRGDGNGGLAALGDRLEEINAAVKALPETLSMQPLQDKVRALASSVEHFARAQPAGDPKALSMIEERLDEISRAIAASATTSKSAKIDPEPFQRIEARVASLAHQIEELLEDGSSSEVIDRLNSLSSRVDSIAERVEIPEGIVERLANQIALISEKLENEPAPPDPELLLKGLEDRFEILANTLQQKQGDALAQSHALFGELERRLDKRGLDEGAAEQQLIATMENRFADLQSRIDARETKTPDSEAIRQLDTRLEDISRRLEETSSRTGSVDPEIIRNLEEWTANLTEQMSQSGQASSDFDNLGQRLDLIEQAIAGSREAILQAAQRAAENAVETYAATRGDPAEVPGLADELRALDSLTRKSDERNARTFEAIHDTLLKIVDRLGDIERQETTPSGQADEKLSVADAPSIAPNDQEPMFSDEEQPTVASVEPNRSPAEAAAAAASAALDNGEEPEKLPAPKKSMLGGISRVLSRKGRADASMPTAGAQAGSEVTAPEVSLEAPIDPEIANQPLEPGSGAPDLNAIIKRVRDERGQSQGARVSDTAKSDFIAAARRAAQAAAEEADVVKRGKAATTKKPASGAGAFFKSRRKPILMATTAVLVALAALQLGRAFMSSDEAVAEHVDPVANTETDTASLTAAALPQTDIAETGQVDDQPDEVMAQASAENAMEGEGDGEAAEIVLPSDSDDMTAETDNADPVPDDMEVAAIEPEAEPAMAGSAEPDNGDAIAALTPASAGPEALREAADAGNPAAMFETGNRYAEGRGVETDMEKAAEWYRRSAEAGLAPAQYRLGNFYEKGTGVDRDIASAEKWYEAAAKQGNASAMHNLAVLYAMGADGEADNKAAVTWFMEAAENGVKDSQYNLGILAAKGAGMPQNLEESYKWFALAARTGDKDAAEKRDEVAKALRPEQLEKAKAATELWKPREIDAAANTVEIPDAWTDADAETASIDMKKALTNVQLILNKNGYDAGPADGIMGDKTHAAIRSFQRDSDMDATGELDESVIRALLDRK